MSVLVFAGASQFVAIGYVAGGFSWLVIVGLTTFLNARHLLYSAALAPYVTDQPRWVRALMAHTLTDEAFALAIAHFRRVGRADVPGYWIGAFVTHLHPVEHRHARRRDHRRSRSPTRPSSAST